MLQFHPMAILLVQVMIVVVLSERLAPVSRPQLGHKVCHGRSVCDKVARVKIQIHVFRCLIDPASVHELAAELVGTDDLPQHFVRMLTDSNDLRVNDLPRHITHDRFAVLPQRKNSTEKSIVGKNCFQRFFELLRVHLLLRKLQAERIAGPGLRRRV